MEKRLLFNRVALECRDITEGHFELSVLIESNFADAALPFANEAAMAAGVTENLVALGLTERADDGPHVHRVGLDVVGDLGFHDRLLA